MLSDPPATRAAQYTVLEPKPLPWRARQKRLQFILGKNEGKDMEEKYILQRFQGEVMNLGAGATLPCNLTDYWLSEIQKHLEMFFESMAATEGSKTEQSMALPLAAVVHILFAKGSTEKLEVSLDEMSNYFEYYRAELTLEEIRRKSDLKAEPASIQTIFTNRDVSITEIP